MNAIEKWNNRLRKRQKIMFWSVVACVVLAHVALYVWFDEFVAWVDSLGVEIVVTRPR